MTNDEDRMTKECPNDPISEGYFTPPGFSFRVLTFFGKGIKDRDVRMERG